MKLSIKKIKNLLKNKYNKVPLDSYYKTYWGVANLISDVEEYNMIAEFAFSLGKLKLTFGGHLAKVDFLTQGATWVGVVGGKASSFEFIMYYLGFIYRFVYRPALPTDEVGFTGLDALKLMKKECGDILKPYALKTNEEVAEVKKSIPKAMIRLTSFGELLRNKDIQNVVHIDINSAFPAGVVATHPEFKDFFERHYALRHTDSIHKAVMNYAIGAAQSLKIRGDRYPQLAKDGIQWTNDKLNNLTSKLRDKGYFVLGYNTDGVFYQMGKNKEPYTDDDEGVELGQWKTDAVFDRIRFKSAGSYEYEINGVYHPVVRGTTRLDRVKSRTNWEWGDIYQAIPLAAMIKNNQLVEVEAEIEIETEME